MKQELKIKEITLEIKVKKCKQMVLNLDCLKQLNPNLTRKIFEGNSEISVELIDLRSGQDVFCSMTGKACVLYQSRLLIPGKINYFNLDRCPCSGDSIGKYMLRGVQKDSLFFSSKISEII